MAETLLRSSLGALKPGDRVNLERPMQLNARLGGHLVQGHVDGVGSIKERIAGEHWEIVRVSLPSSASRYVVAKGSITVDGVVADRRRSHADDFTVSLIPTTLDLTTLGSKQPGAAVNLEVDVIAKYTERLLGLDATSASAPTATPTSADRSIATGRVVGVSHLFDWANADTVGAPRTTSRLAIDLKEPVAA